MRNPLLRALACVAALACPARAQTVLFSDGFENGLSNWSATGLWHLVDTTDTCGSQVAPFPEGTHCVYYGVPGVCNYDTGAANSGELTLLAPIALPAFGPAASLHCWTRHQAETCWFNTVDNFDIQVSTNGGASWINVGRRCNMDQQAPDEWEPRNIDLTPYLGQSLLLRFRFDTVDALFNFFRGAFVDRVEVRLEVGHPFCGSSCPCGNPPASYEDPSIGYGAFAGCTHSQASHGELAGAGVASVSNDTLVLSATHCVTPSVVLFLQATGSTGGGFSGDGRFCLAGTSVRLAVTPATSGSASIPAPGAPPLSVAGSIPAIGGTRYYQAVYRDPTAWCTAATLNFTNGYTISWSP